MSTRERLVSGLQALNLNLSEDIQQKLMAYAAMLLKWNKVYNLTAIRDENTLIDLHLLDSLAVLPYVNVASVADIGTGGGLPGIPLAICKPEMAVDLVETVNKKASFLQQARIELKLPNVTVQNLRVENFKPELQHPAVISRAFSSITDFIQWTDHLVAPDGCWLAMKGVYPADELAMLPAGYAMKACHKLVVPGVDAERHLVIIARN